MSMHAQRFCIQLTAVAALIIFYACNNSTHPSPSRETQEDTGSYDGKLDDYEGTTFLHEDLQDNTQYYHVVTAQNSIGQESDVSAEVSATAVGGPVGPADLSATAGDRRVTLNWTAAPGFVYNVYWSTETGVSKTDYQEKISGIDADIYVHEDCESVRYYYIVTAENDLGESDPVDEVSAAPGRIVLEGGEDYEYALASSTATPTAALTATRTQAVWIFSTGKPA